MLTPSLYNFVQISSARLESDLWVLDNRGRVKYRDSQWEDSEVVGERLEYCGLRHPLPFDIRSQTYRRRSSSNYSYRADSWLVVSVLVTLDDVSRLSRAGRDTRILTAADFQDAEDPVTQMKLVTDRSKSVLRDDRFLQRA